MVRKLTAFMVTMALLGVSASSVPAQAQLAPIPVTDFGNFTMLSTMHSEQIQQLVKQAEELHHQLEMIANQAQQLAQMKQQLLQLPDALWQQAQDKIAALGDLMDQERQQVQSETKLSKVFDNLYPDYVPPVDFPQVLQAWDYNNEKAAKDVLAETEHAVKANQQIKGQLTDAGQMVHEGAKAKSQIQVMEGAARIAQLQVSATQNLSDIEALKSKFEVTYYMRKLEEDKRTSKVDQGTNDWIQRGLKQAQNPNLTTSNVLRNSGVSY